MLREATVIGVIVVRRTEVQPFTDKQVELVTTFADQAVIAIENVRLFQELEGRNKDLTESLEQQTATSEILKVISSSPTDVQPVFDTIAANSLRLCVARWSAVTRFDGQVIELVSLHGLTDPAGIEALRRAFPRPPSRAGATDRAILARTIAHVRDVREDPEYQWHELAQAAGYRSQLSVPMLREGQPIGAITVAGASPGSFSERQVDLLRPLPTRRSSRSRTSVSSRSSMRAITTSRKRSSSRRRPARSSRSSAARPSTSSRS